MSATRSGRASRACSTERCPEWGMGSRATPGLACAFVGLGEPEDTKVRVGQGGPGLGERRIPAHRELQLLDRPAAHLRVVREQLGLGAEIRLVGRQILRHPALEQVRLLRSQRGPQRSDDAPGHLALDLEEVVDAQLTVVGLRPQVLVGPGVDQLGEHTHPVSRTLDTALEDVRDSKLPGNLGDLLRRIAVLHHRGPRDDLERADLRELGHELVVNAVDKRRVGLVGAAVRERKDGDRAAVTVPRRRLVGARAREIQVERDPQGRREDGNDEGRQGHRPPGEPGRLGTGSRGRTAGGRRSSGPAVQCRELAAEAPSTLGSFRWILLQTARDDPGQLSGEIRAPFGRVRG